MEVLKYIIFAIFLVIIAFSIMKNRCRRSELEIEDDDYDFSFSLRKDVFPYQRKALLSKDEALFYKDLKQAADRLSLSVLIKMRVGDIVEVTNAVNGGEWLKYFNKVSGARIDFALCEPETLKIVLLIVLDDSTRKADKTIQQEELIQRICNISGYTLLRVTDADDLENKIKDKIR